MSLCFLQKPELPIDNWVLCRIFLKRRSSANPRTEDEEAGGVRKSEEVREDHEESKPVFYEFLASSDRMRTDLNHAPCSSSSGSSGLTIISSNRQNNGLEDHADSSSCNSFSFQFL